MSLAEADWQAQILLEVGARLDGNSEIERAAFDVLTTRIATIWSAWAFKNYYPNLQYLYAKRQAIDTLMGQLRLCINKTLGALTMQLAGKFQNLLQMRQETSAQIDVAEKSAASNRTPEMSTITKKAPIEPAIVDPQTVQTVYSPNDPRYRGSPFTRYP